MIAGRYRLEEVVGSGGMGEVWRATDLELRRVVAVKRARSGSGELIRREARIGAGLQHPNVVVVFDVIRERLRRWLVMEYLPSRSLAEILRAGDLIPAGKAAEIGAQVASALAAMHAKGIVHRDITPGNVLVTDDGTAKLTDLGIAVWANVTEPGDDDKIAGTPGFMATEVTDGEAAGPASDIYALGATLSVVTEGGTPLPEDVLNALMHPDPKKRPTAAKARAILLEVAGDPPVDEDTPSIIPRQLPPAPAGFEGRERELGSMDETGVTLAIGGLGGVGKTWLAMQWAHSNLQRFPDGQLFVNLQGFDPAGREPMPPETALRGFLSALGVAPGDIPADQHSQVGLYRSLVAGRRMLILLDNARDSQHVLDLLPGTPACTVLITSRDRMLDLATTHGAHTLALDGLSEDEARELLAGRLGEERVEKEPEAFDEILGYCAGLPLALAIVAGRATAHRKFSLLTFAAELRSYSSRLDALDAGGPTTSLATVLSLSDRALLERHAEIFELLGLAPGPDIALPAAASLINGTGAEARIALRTLERQSLVDEHLPGRWRMHDLVRLHAAELAHDKQETEERLEALIRLVDFYLYTAHRATVLLNPLRKLIDLGKPPAGCTPLSLADGAAALEWFDAEQPCLLAVQQLAVEIGWDIKVWQLASTLNTFHSRRGRVSDDLTVWQLGLAAAERLDDSSAKALAHRCLGHGYARANRQDEALDHLRQALALFELTDDRRGQGHCHQILAWIWEQRGDDQLAMDHSVLARSHFHEVGQPALEAMAFNAMGWYAGRLGRYDEARIHCEAALDLFRLQSFPEGEAETLDSLGFIALKTGRYADAVEHYQRALVMFREAGNAYAEANTLAGLGNSHTALGDLDQAREAWQAAVELYRKQGRAEHADDVQARLNDASS